MSSKLKVNCEIHSSLNWNKFWIKNPIWIFRTFQFKLLLFSQLLSLNRLSNRVTLTKIKVFILFSAILANFWLFTRHQEKTRETLRNSSWKKKENVFCCEKLLKNKIFGKYTLNQWPLKIRRLKALRKVPDCRKQQLFSRCPPCACRLQDEHRRCRVFQADQRSLRKLFVSKSRDWTMCLYGLWLIKLSSKIQSSESKVGFWRCQKFRIRKVCHQSLSTWHRAAKSETLSLM